MRKCHNKSARNTGIQLSRFRQKSPGSQYQHKQVGKKPPTHCRTANSRLTNPASAQIVEFQKSCFPFFQSSHQQTNRVTYGLTKLRTLLSVEIRSGRTAGRPERIGNHMALVSQGDFSNKQWPVRRKDAQQQGVPVAGCGCNMLSPSQTAMCQPRIPCQVGVVGNYLDLN